MHDLDKRGAAQGHEQGHNGRTGSKGGGLFKFPTPPPPTLPKFANPSFSNLRFWGKGWAPKAPKILF